MIYGFVGEAQSGKNTCATIWQLLDGLYNNNPSESMEKSLNWDIEYVKYIFKKLDGDPTYKYLSIYSSSYRCKAFATKLKQVVCIITGCTMEQLEDNSIKNTKVPEWLKVWVTSYKYSSLTTWEWVKVLHASKEDSDEYKKNYLKKKVTFAQEISTKEYLPTYRELLQNVGTELFKEQISPAIWINSLMSEYKPSDNWLISDVRFLDEAKSITDKGGILIKIEVPEKEKDYRKKVHRSEREVKDIVTDYTVYKSTIEELTIQIKNIMINENIIKV